MARSDGLIERGEQAVLDSASIRSDFEQVANRRIAAELRSTRIAFAIRVEKEERCF